MHGMWSFGPPAGAVSLFMLMIALILGLTIHFARDLRLVRRIRVALAAGTAGMIGHLRGLPPVLRAIAGCDAASALPITVRVLLHDSAQRDRLLRHVAETLRHCAAALGDPADACAVVVVRELEREGRPLKGCVERLSYPDGTCRAIVSLPLSEGGRPLTLDEIAARLVRYYPALIAAERAVIVADAPPGPAALVSAATPSAARPLPAALAPVPAEGHPDASRGRASPVDTGRARG